MKHLASVSRKWWFFAGLILAQFVLLPFAGADYHVMNLEDIIHTTLRNSFQTRLGEWNVYFQTLSLLMIVGLILFRNRFKRIFTAYVAVSYLAFAFLQNMAVTPRYGFSMITVNVVMFLFVAYVWIREITLGKNDYSFANLRWKYSWMILVSVFAYLCPLSPDGSFDWNPLHFFGRNSATAFCLTTPLFLTLLTLNLPQVNIVVFRFTAVVGTIIGLYNMFSLLNPHTVNVGILHIPLLVVSAYACVLGYSTKDFRMKRPASRRPAQFPGKV